MGYYWRYSQGGTGVEGGGGGSHVDAIPLIKLFGKQEISYPTISYPYPTSTQQFPTPTPPPTRR